VIWIVLTISVVSLAIALLAMRWARVAHRLVTRVLAAEALAADALAEQSGRPAVPAEERTTFATGFATGIRGRVEEPVPGEPTRRQHIAAALDDAGTLSRACHVAIDALDAGGEPPTPSDYTRVRRCSDLFTISVGRMRAPHHGDLVRELTDELVTLHHSLVTEIRQHQEARYPFVGAKDTTLAGQMLRKVDAELARLGLKIIIA
jgi:hypothetical protein